MTLFEYTAIAYCLVLSFAVARSASVLPHALASGRRYWVHATWVFVNLGFCLVVFWNFWSFRDVEWTLGLLCLQLAVPTSVFVFSSILAPDEPSKVRSWRDYFYSVRVKLFVCGLVFNLLVVITATLLLDMPLAHPLRLGQAGGIGVSLVGIVSDQPRVQAVLAILVLVGFALMALRLLAAPGALASGS